MKYISNTEEKEIGMILKPLQDEVLVQQMRAFIQHGSVSTYDHSLNVAKTSYMINRIFQIHSDKEVLLMGAMLHDFYLYDWHDKHNARKMHGFSHAELACENAEKYLDVPKETRNVIYCHMWPLNLTRIPPSKEAWIVCVADKVVSLHESLFMR